MIRETIISTLIASAVGGGALTAGKFWADNTYIRQDTFLQAERERRAYQLQDRIDDIKDSAEHAGRNLTQGEKQKIKDLQRQIGKLK